MVGRAVSQIQVQSDDSQTKRGGGGSADSRDWGPSGSINPELILSPLMNLDLSYAGEYVNICELCNYSVVAMILSSPSFHGYI